jgi:hypothetical protein
VLPFFKAVAMRTWQRSRTALSLAVALLSLCPPAQAQNNVSVIETPSVRLPASAHEGSGRLRVRAAADQRVLLTLGPLVDVSTKEVLPATIVLTETSSKAAEFDAKANVVYDVTVSVSKVLFEGEAQAPILNNNTKIGDLQIVRAAFAVSLVSDTPISFRENTTTAIPIKNDSRDGYRVSWMMQIGPHKYCGNRDNSCEDVKNWATVALQPKERAVIEVTPPVAWFRSELPGWLRYSGAFRRQVADATLSFALPNEVPRRTLTPKADLSGQYYVELVWIISLLALGALMSLLVRYWVPNTQRKRDLKDQVRRIQGKIAGLSTEIDSTLRALVQVQLNLIDNWRKSTATFLPDYATVAGLCSQAAGALERRVEMIEEIDSTYEQASAKWESSPPPSQVDEVESLLRTAADVLRKPQPSEADFLNARRFIDQARTVNERIGTDDEEFGKKLASRRDEIRKEMRKLANGRENGAANGAADGAADGEKDDVYQRLKNALPGVFRIVDPESRANGAAPPPEGTPPADGNPLADSTPIPSQQHAQVDYDICALTVVRDYIWLYEGSAHPAFREEIAKIESQLISHLSHKSWNELRLARLLLKQFREHNSVAQVLAAIKSGEEQMFVEQEPRGALVEAGVVTVYARQFVQFRAHFRQEELNWSAARENFACVWDFGDGHKDERGWSASHFFPDVHIPKWYRSWLWIRSWFKTTNGEEAESGPWRRYPVRVAFKDRAGIQIDSSLQPLMVEVRPDPNDDRRTRSVGEVVGLLVSIAVPFLALIAGARDQLAQNPAGAAMTVFLLGYSSESIISVFKQRTSQQQ